MAFKKWKDVAEVQEAYGKLEIKIANPFMYALSKLQEAMEGEAERVGWKSEEDVVEFIREMRHSTDENIY